MVDRIPHIAFLVALGVVITAASVIGPRAAGAQSNEFRDTRAHFGLGGGVFTFHGPIDLTRPRTDVNFVREHDPGIAVLGSFPILSERFYFRGLVLVSNVSTEDGRDLVGDGRNAYLTESVLVAEPEIVWTLRPGSRSRVLPYLFTGFGATIAAPFGSDGRNEPDRPGSGVPGPDRSVFHLPIGAGVDVALSGCFSVFGEASYRWDLNYVWRNEVDYHPHQSSLILFGLRTCVRNPFRPESPPAGPIPAPVQVPAYAPPLQRIEAVCDLAHLNSVYFPEDSSDLDDRSRRLLDENLDALRLNPACYVILKGLTDHPDSIEAAERLARLRAEAVRDYYLSRDLAPERILRIEIEGRRRSCKKGDECTMNRRVDSTPVDYRDD
ncbi:MAG: OmpA family protein [Rhodothermales bacterium]|nr:OmpA family protein [Rhodothermales bacterium]